MRYSKTLSRAMILAGLFYSCQTPRENLSPRAKQEIRQMEKDFQQMTTERGIKVSFPFYADSNAVVKGHTDSLIIGKDAITHFYNSAVFNNATVTWSPDFIDASEDGNFGYSYGKYVFHLKDSTGKVNDFTGIFHTIWKRQKDGTWKYVWD